MIDAHQPTSSFTKMNVSAAPANAAQVRREFEAWLHHTFALDPVRSSDVVLAVYEAMANAAECAYADTCAPGAMHIHADYDSELAGLTVEVRDDGMWQPPDRQACDPSHGRGIPLMRALTDQVDITATSAGTVVRMQWHNVGVRRASSCSKEPEEMR